MNNLIIQVDDATKIRIEALAKRANLSIPLLVNKSLALMDTLLNLRDERGNIKIANGGTFEYVKLP